MISYIWLRCLTTNPKLHPYSNPNCKIITPTLHWPSVDLLVFLPRCMQCRRGLAMRILSVCPSVCLSVRLSVTRVYCDKTVERSAQIYIPYER